MHERFAAQRVNPGKEFFRTPPPDAVSALQRLAEEFAAPAADARLRSDLLPHFKKYFGAYLDPAISSAHLVQAPGYLFLEVGRQASPATQPVLSKEEIPLGGLLEPDEPTLETLRKNDAMLRACDAYDWIMIGNLFPADVAREIANQWEGPGGPLSGLQEESHALDDAECDAT